MDCLQKIAEDRIRAAQDEGLFDNLSGKGKPLNLEDDAGVPEDMRLAFKILKNAGCLPVEMEIRKEIYNIRQLLNAAVDEETRKELKRELSLLVLREAVACKRSPFKRN